MFDLLVYIGLFVSFVFFIPGRLDGDEQVSHLILAFIAVLPFFFSVKHKIKIWWLGICVITTGLSLAFNYTVPCRWEFINLLVGCLALKSISERVEMREKTLGILLFIFFVVQSGMSIWQKLHGWNEPTGTFFLPWVYGCAATLAIPFIFKINPLACISLIIPIYFSFSTACFGIALIVFLMMFRSIDLKWFLLIPAGIIGYIVFVDHSIDQARFPVIVQSFKYIHNHLIGNGLGSFAHEAFAKQNGITWIHWRWAHNELYQMYFETGIIGLLSTLGFLIWSLIGQNRTIFVALLGALMLSMVHPIFHFGKLTVFLILIFSLAAKRRNLWLQEKSALLI